MAGPGRLKLFSKLTFPFSKNKRKIEKKEVDIEMQIHDKDKDKEREKKKELTEHEQKEELGTEKTSGEGNDRKGKNGNEGKGKNGNGGEVENVAVPSSVDGGKGWSTFDFFKCGKNERKDSIFTTLSGHLRAAGCSCSKKKEKGSAFCSCFGKKKGGDGDDNTKKDEPSDIAPTPTRPRPPPRPLPPLIYHGTVDPKTKIAMMLDLLAASLMTSFSGVCLDLITENAENLPMPIISCVVCLYGILTTSWIITSDNTSEGRFGSFLMVVEIICVIIATLCDAFEALWIKHKASYKMKLIYGSVGVGCSGVVFIIKLARVLRIRCNESRLRRQKIKLHWATM